MSVAVATARPQQALRLRRESQRAGVARNIARPATAEDEGAKQETRRYVYLQQDILAKHRGKSPSLRVYLHPNHFRINDSQETLSYASPMRELLQAIRHKVIPHNMVEDFYELDIPWYDNCLIVEIHDYRSGGVKSKDHISNTRDDGATPFSIHNYNSFITPSPFAPFPLIKPDEKPTIIDTQSNDATSKENKESVSASGTNNDMQKQSENTRVTTVVLFPTPQSHLMDIQLLTTTPILDTAMLKRMQAASRAAGMPPTPLTTVPPTPAFSSGPSPKRQKMILDDNNVHEFEAGVYSATCPKLYLEPTKSLRESRALMDAITHPNNHNPAPTRKARKRTTAELAADEADAATLQRFMLAGDEQAMVTATASGNDEGAVRAAANSQTFSRFKTLANIKANHEEAERRKKEEDARVAHAKRQAMAEAEAQKRRDVEVNMQNELVERQKMLRQQAQQQAQLQQNQNQSQNQQNEALRAATHAQQIPIVAAAQISQTPQVTNQHQFSPIVQQQTPLMAAAASPRIGGQVSHAIGGTPMIATVSNPAMASPVRPPSAISHNPMTRTVSQQQDISRTGTPQMVHGTPIINTAIPNHNMTPTPSRMNQGSPSRPLQGQTPMMIQPPQPGQSMNPEQMNRWRLQMQHQNVSPNGSGLQGVAYQKAIRQIELQGIPPGQTLHAYRNQLAAQFLRQMQQQQQQQTQQQPQPQQAMQNLSPQAGMPQNGMPQHPSIPMSNMTAQQLRQMYNQRKNQALSTYGQNIPAQILQQLNQLEMAIKSRESQSQQHHIQQRNSSIQGQMQAQMSGMQNVQNPIQMQQYQHMLQQRANRLRQQQMLLSQQVMQANGQMAPGMMSNMQNMNMGQMNMGNMGNLQGMNMAQMQNMQGMGGLQGAQGMQGINMGQMNQQQHMQHQMMIMQQAQQQAQQQAAQRMGQQGQQQGVDIGWSGV